VLSLEVNTLKTCQTCQRTYEDDTLSFCLYDGSVLTAGGTDPQATQRIPVPQTTEPFASNAPPLSQAPTAVIPPQQQPQQNAWAQPQKPGGGGGKAWLVFAGIAALLLLAVGIGLGIVLSRGQLFGARTNTNEQSNGNARGNYRPYNGTGNTAGTPQATPTPEVSAAEKLGLIGNWSGVQNGGASRLTIVSGQGNTFTGTKFQRDNQVSFTGTIDPATRRITIRETKLLKGTPYNGKSGWSLASETGALSADGRKISGTGTDEYNRKAPYTWSYTKK
jgi:hypothetical protein